MLTREKGNFRGARLHPSHGLPPRRDRGAARYEDGQDKSGKG
jgi:hypothetical protein